MNQNMNNLPIFCSLFRLLTVFSAFFISVISLSAFAIDRITTPEEAGIVSGNAALDILPPELISLENKALKGDGRAALKLAHYYSTVVLDQKQAVYWDTISAENGDVIGMYELGYMLRYTDKIRARYWMTQASKLGYAPADELLKEIDMDKLQAH